MKRKVEMILILLTTLIVMGCKEEKLPIIDTKAASVEIRLNKAVKDVDIQQTGNKLNLVVIVNSSVKKKEAQKLGADYVRLVMVKSKGLENKPMFSSSNKVGQTKYEYKVGIFNSNKEIIAMGAKLPDGVTIFW
jgi:hypothetical protein